LKRNVGQVMQAFAMRVISNTVMGLQRHDQ